MSGKLKIAIPFIVIVTMTTVLLIAGACRPSVDIKHGDKTVATSVCGVMYSVDESATRGDFQLLLQKTRKACKDESLGTATSYRNSDGDLKHVVIIGDEDIIKTKGTPFDVCVINWELDQVTAMRAFEDVCLNRQF